MRFRAFLIGGAWAGGVIFYNHLPVKFKKVWIEAF